MGRIFKIILLLVVIALVIFAFFEIRNSRTKKTSYILPSTAGDGQQFGLTGLYGEEEYRLAAETGAKWIRPQLNWTNVQGEGKEINFQRLDDLYNQAQKYGFKIMISLRTGHQSPWPTKCDLKLCEGKKGGCPDDFASCPPADYNQYRDFVFALASHFKGKVDFYIIENEVNTLTFWNGTADDYLKLRKTAYEAIHQANPQAVVLDSGIASEAWIEIVARDKFCKEGEKATRDFLAQAIARRYANPQDAIDKVLPKFSCQGQEPILDRGAEMTMTTFKEPESFDALAFHYYEPYGLLPEVIDWIKNKMKSSGYAKDIYLTEGGYFDSLTSPNNANSQDQVAQDLVKLHAITFGNGLKSFIWLPAVQKDNKGIPKSYWGLYVQNKQLLSAGAAYEILISKIGNFSQAEKVLLKDGINAYKFKIGNKNIYIVWSDSSTQFEIKSLSTSISKATDYLGHELGISNGSLNLSSKPVYLE